LYFPSKKDTWLALVIWGVVILMGWQMVSYKSLLWSMLSLLIIAYLLWLWFGTGYKIEGRVIKIRSGPLRRTVKITEITKISATKNPLSAHALSIDRIEIMYGKYDTAIISPKNKAHFINVLVTENPDIQVDKNLFK